MSTFFLTGRHKCRMLLVPNIRNSHDSVKTFLSEDAMNQNGIRYHVGIGGWEHDVLDSCLYPTAGLSSARKLEIYARYFDTTGDPADILGRFPRRRGRPRVGGGSGSTERFPVHRESPFLADACPDAHSAGDTLVLRTAPRAAAAPTASVRSSPSSPTPSRTPARTDSISRNSRLR